MADSKDTKDTGQNEKKATEKQADTKTDSKKNNDTVTVKGRISTTVLRAGKTATVTRTDTIDQLLDSGYLTEVKDKK